jgi:hypothetical protein
LGAAGFSQQPKQSQPFGVNGPQKPVHGVDWVVTRVAHVEPLTFTFGLYEQVGEAGDGTFWSQERFQ